MLQLKNQTPFAAQIALFADRYGVETLYIIVKAVFNIGPKWTLADEQLPPLAEDEYWGDDPTTSSIKKASDFHIGKPASDIILIGHAQAADGRAVTQMDVACNVGAVSKTLRVFGEREWRDGEISSPQPFDRMPLVFERAFGGVHRDGDCVIDSEDRNPVGCGFAGERKAAQLNGEPLPNIEDPESLMRSQGDRPVPAGFGIIAPTWLPRKSYAGTYDETWQKKRSPYLPEDFDPRFFNMAHPDLIYPGYLQGGEPVEISGMSPHGPLAFNLPVVNLSSEVMIGGNKESPGFNLETAMIDTDMMTLELCWRAAMPCDKRALKISQVKINLARHNGRRAA